VATLLGCKAAQGLFRAAIPQSGGAHHTLPQDAASEVSDWFLAHLGVDDPAGLEAASVDAILDAQSKTIRDLESGAGFVNKLGVAVSPFYPVHGTPLLPDPPIHAIRLGMGASVPVLTGSNAHETTLWGYGNVDETKLQRAAQSYQAQAVVDACRAAYPHEDAQQTLIRLTTDHMFRIPAIRLAEAREPHGGQTWMYWFCWQSRAFEGRLKATHALEIPFAFNNLKQPGVDVFLGPGDLPQGVADDMHAAWTRFIRDLDPGWPAYTTDSRQTWRFAEDGGIVGDPEGAVREAWAGIR
jgi:carboxylesterase type B